MAKYVCSGKMMVSGVEYSLKTRVYGSKLEVKGLNVSGGSTSPMRTSRRYKSRARSVWLSTLEIVVGSTSGNRRKSDGAGALEVER
jgi:hypothetical protein